MIFQLNKTSTTSIVAVLITLLTFVLLAYLCFKYGDDATTRTQIITGLFAALALPCGYYFGMSKNRGQSGTNVQQADEVNVTATGQQ